jgi:hypothetical protein
MDFAFAPGLEFDHLRLVLSRRPNTTVVDDAAVTTIAAFLQYLKGHNLQGGDLIIGSHGTDEGQLLIALDPAQMAASDPRLGPQTTFETLQQHNTITIPASVKGPNTSVRLFGCLIGSQNCRPFLTLLKQRFGSPKNVSAPVYVHTTHSPDGGVNFFEFMKNDFKIFNKDGFTTRAQLIAAYKGSHQTFLIDGKPVPDANWETWIPAAVEPLLKPAVKNELALNISVTVSPAADGVAIMNDKMGSWTATLESFTESGIPMSGSIPTDPTALLAFVEQALGKDPGFGPVSTNNPYPVFKRYLSNSLHEFVLGWNWKVTLAGGGKFDFAATRYRYDVMVPVTSASTSSDLIFNYYPASGSPKLNFGEGDTRLFGVV